MERVERRLTTVFIWVLAIGAHAWVLYGASLATWRWIEAPSPGGSIQWAAPRQTPLPLLSDRPAIDTPRPRVEPAPEAPVVSDPSLWEEIARGAEDRDSGVQPERLPTRPVEEAALVTAWPFESRNVARYERMGCIGTIGPVEPRPFGGRARGRRLRNEGGPTDATEEAVHRGLSWLARHQAEDGHWAAKDFDRCCPADRCSGHGDPGNDVGLTALAILPFLGAGYTPLSTESWIDGVTGRRIRPGEVVRQGLRWLLAQQHPSGMFEMRHFPVYNSALATLAVCEAHGLTGSAALGAPGQRGIDALVQAQNPYKAWRYSPRCSDNDTSNTGFVMMAYHAAQTAGLRVPQSSLDWAEGYLDEVTDPYGPVGYMTRGDGGSVIYPRTQAWKRHPSMTAVGVMCRVFLDGGPTHVSVRPGVAILGADRPEWSPGKVDAYYWYYGSLATFLATDEGSADWKRWHAAMVEALVPNQHGGKDGCLDGSWDPEVDRVAMEGAGRIYMTALNVLTLQVTYRYPRTFGARK